MTEKEQAELLLDMTAHPGWAVLCEITQGHVDGFKAGMPFNIKTLEELYFARGMLAALEDMLRVRDRAEAALNEGEG